MHLRPSIVRLEEFQLEAASDILARAFLHDPLNTYLLPNPADREDLLFWYYGTIVQYGLDAGDVYTSADCDGVAVWLRYGAEESGADRLQQAGLADTPDVFGIEAFTRLVGVIGYLERVRKRGVQPRHWYLPALGVDPASQGSGIGGTLLRQIFSRADADGIPCYLETFQPRNLPFYRRHEFVAVADEVEPSSGLRFWTFCRDPRD